MRKLSTILFASVLLTCGLAEGIYAQATRLVLRTGAGDSTVTLTASQSQNLLITARTAGGVIDTTYDGPKNLTFSGANSSISPAVAPTVEDNAGVPQAFATSTTIQFTNGVASVTGGNNGVMRLYRAETVNISASDGSIGTGTGTDRLLATVNPSTLGKFAWSLTSPQRNGTSFTGTNTLTAQDDWGNTVTSYNANSPSSNNVTITTSLNGAITGLGASNNNVLNQAGDFVSGVANLSTQLMIYTGVGGSGTFTATGGGKTGTSSSVQITAAAATHLVLRTAIGDSVINVQAGTTQNLKITAKDANGNTDLTYTGTKSLTFSGANSSPSPVTAPTVSNAGGGAVNFGTATLISFSNGEATASGSSNGVMLLYGVQTTATISVTDQSISSTGNNALTATVSAGALGKFTWSLTSPQTNGVAFTGTGTLTAQDFWGNTHISFDASVTPVTMTSSLSGTITGLGSGVNNILNRNTDFSSGIATLAGKMIYTGASGSGTFTATGGGKSGTSSSIQINAGAATRLIVRTTAGDSVISIGAGVAQGLKITARDAAGNIATGYTGSKTLYFFGANVSPAPESTNPTVVDNAGTPRDFSASPNTPITFSSGVATISGGNNGMMRLQRVETASVGASDGSITASSADQLTATVTPAGLKRFSVVLTSSQINRTPFTGVNTVTAIDSFGNVATNFNASTNNVTVTPVGLAGTISGLGSGGSNLLNQSGDFALGIANVTGKMKFTGTVGTGTFTATSLTGRTGTSGNVTINVGSTSRFAISGNLNQQAGSGQSLTITAMDSSGNTATGYAGDKTVRFSGSGPSSNPVTYPTVSDKDGFAIQFGAQLNITFTAGIAQVSGGSNGVMRLYRAGKDTVAVSTTDGTVSSGSGDRLILTVTEDALQKFVFTLASPQQSGIAFTGTNTLVAQDSYGNTVTGFSAASDNVTVSANSPLSGTISGLGSGSNNLLNQASDFSVGVANLTGKIVFTGATGSAPFTAFSSTSKVGTSGTVQIVAGGATRLVINGLASMSAGSAQNLTITAKDASGNTVSTYTGSKSLTFSGADSSISGSAPTVNSSSGTAIAFGVATPITFTNGIASVAGSNNGVLRLYRAQTAIVSATDQTISSSGADRLTVTVAPSSLGRFAWSLTSPQTNGVPFAGANALTAQDDWGNTIASFDASAAPVTITTSLAGVVSGLGSGTNNVLNRAGDFVSGVANLTTLGMKYTGAIGTGTFTATGGGKTGISPSILVSAGSASRLVVRASTGDSVITMIAGAVKNLTITAKDASGNTVTTYAGAKTLTFSGADSSLNPATSPTVSNSGGTATAFGAGTVLTFTNGIATVTGSSNGVMKLYRAQAAMVSVTDGTQTSSGTDRLSVTVSPAALGKFAWVLSTPQVNAVAFTGANTLTAQDDWGNPLTAYDASASNVTVTTSLTGTVSGLGTSSNNILNKANDFVAGVANLTSIGMKYTGNIGSGTFTATSAGKAGTSLSVTITPGGAGKLVITGSGTQTAGTPQSLTITAKDASDNLVLTYTGIKTLTFTGANPSTSPLTQPSVTDNAGVAVSFGSATSILFTNGVATVSAGSNGAMKLYKAETATIAVSDGAIGSTGADRLTVAVAPAALGKFAWVLTSPQINGVPWTGTNTLTAQDDWGNSVPTFDAATNNVTLTTSLSASPSAISGLGTLGNNVLNQSPNFVLGVANLTGLGMKYTGLAGTGTFTATSTVGSKSGTSDSTTVNNSVPTFTSIVPSEGSRSQVVPVTVAGTNFLPGVTVLNFGQDFTIDSLRVESTTRITARVRPGPAATLGLRDVTVSNPAPGGGSATLTGAFRVKNLPSITSLSPSAGVRGQTLNMTITGTNFATGVSDVGIQGSSITLNSTAVTSPTTIVANISISLSALDGVRLFHVTNSGVEGGMSNLTGFTVGSNPLPVVTSISPALVTRGQSLELTIKGSNYFNGITSVNLGPGIVITGTTIDSTTQLRVTATVAETAATGPHHVILTNAPPGGGPDTLKNGLTINNPAPTLTGLSVQNATRLQTLFITLTGTRFINNVTTVVLGSGITFVATVAESPTQLRVGFTVDSSAALGPRNVKVTNPAPGGGSDSLVGALTISNPIPSITTISPESTMVGGGALQMTVTGTNFVPGAVVRLGGRALTSIVVDRTRMTATVAVSDIDTARSSVVDVNAPTPGGGTSNTKNFIVQNPVPTLASLAPASGSRLQTLDVTFTGTKFIPGFTQVDFGGTDITTNSITVTSSTLLTANITISATATMGARDIFVKNPTPGGGNSEKRVFTVANNPVPTIAAVTPDGWSRLRTLDVVIDGTNFIAGVTSADFGAGITVNGPIAVNSSTRLTAGITINVTAPTGPRSIAVTNAPPGGGTATRLNGFTVFNPSPKLNYLDPPNGQQLKTLNVVFYGNGFIDGVSSVSMGTGITINEQIVLSDTVITANITITIGATTGPRNVLVNNSGPGGGTSELTNGFVVGNNPAPTLASIAPASAKRLETLNIVFRGSSFVSGVTTVDLGPDIGVNDVNIDSSGKLTANISVTGKAATGARTVFVTNAPPGGGKDSLVAAFTVTNPAPTLTSINPAFANRSQTLNVVLRGTNFIPATVPSFGSGGDVTVNSITVDSTRQLTVNVTVGSAATLGLRNVTVANPVPGGGTSASVSFSVNLAPPPTPALSSPQNGATNLPTTLVLKWDTAAGATQYHLQLSTSSLFLTTVVDDSSLTGPSRQVGPLSNNQTYYWRVRARNGGGTSSFSSTWSFTPLYPDVYPLSNSVQFPSYATAAEYKVKDYRIVGLPGAGTNPLGEYMTGTAGTDWQAYTDNGAGANYFTKYDGTSAFTFSAGKAYWLIKKNPWTVSTSVSTAPLDTSVSVRISLQNGWNLITNPFLHSVPWSSIQLANSPAARSPIWLYDGVNGFSQATTLEPYVGYYFFNSDNVPYIRIPYGASSGVWMKADSSVQDGWTVTVAAKTGEYTDRSLMFGVREDASEGLDRYDYRKPRTIGTLPGTMFRRPDLDSVYSVFAADIRPPVKSLTRWPFELQTPGKETLTLRFEGIGQIPDDLDVYLIDHVHARYADLRSIQDYVFTPATISAQMTVAVGTHNAMASVLSDVLPKVFALDNNFPNPFNPTTTLPVSVPHAAEITLKVYNILGAEVRTVFAGQVEAGRYWIVWDGKNEAGAPVATGVYLARFTADAGVSMVKKMLLMK